MMEKLGVGIESNPLASYMFEEQGFGGMVMAKAWITVIMLFATYVVQIRSHENMYWTINGFMIALSGGGLMAMNANLTTLAGKIPQAPSDVIFTYLVLVLILTRAGSFIDGCIDGCGAHPENVESGVVDCALKVVEDKKY